MKRMKLVLTLLFFLLKAGSFAQPGTPDPEFGTNGIVITDLGSTSEVGRSLAIQPDGKIVVIGETGTGMYDYDFALVRYNTNGSFDNSFGTGGIVITDFNSTDDEARSVILQPDGKIVVAGYSYNLTGEKVFALARYNTNGTLDNTFSGDGKLTVYLNNDDEAQAVTIQNNGKIVIAGTTYDGSQQEFALLRFNTDGSTDNSFGTGGTVTTSFGGDFSVAMSLAIQPDGKIVVTGYAGNGIASDFALARYNPDGTLDNSFSSDGMLTTDFGTDYDYAYSMDIQPNGKILVAGHCYDGISSPDFALAQYNPDGSPDNSFGGNGKVITSVTPNIDEAYSIVHQPDGKIVVAGRTDDGVNSGFVLARYLPAGNLDISFGIGGIVISQIGTSFNWAYSAALDPDGKIVAAGLTMNGTDFDIAVVRYISGLNSVGVLDFSVLENSVLIYPNPVQENSTLGYTLTEREEISIRLIDMQGRVLQTYLACEKQEAGRHQQVIFLPNGLTAGNYLLTISSLKGQMCIKIMK